MFDIIHVGLLSVHPEALKCCLRAINYLLPKLNEGGQSYAYILKTYILKKLDDPEYNKTIKLLEEMKTNIIILKYLENV